MHKLYSLRGEMLTFFMLSVWCDAIDNAVYSCLLLNSNKSLSEHLRALGLKLYVAFSYFALIGMLLFNTVLSVTGIDEEQCCSINIASGLRKFRKLCVSFG